MLAATLIASTSNSSSISECEDSPLSLSRSTTRIGPVMGGRMSAARPSLSNGSLRDMLQVYVGCMPELCACLSFACVCCACVFVLWGREFFRRNFRFDCGHRHRSSVSVFANSQCAETLFFERQRPGCSGKWMENATIVNTQRLYGSMCAETDRTGSHTSAGMPDAQIDSACSGLCEAAFQRCALGHEPTWILFGIKPGSLSVSF